MPPKRGSPGAAVFSDFTWRQLAARLNLSKRETEIVRGVFDDKTECAIAAELGISPHTVHTHCERLHQKLGVADRVQLVLNLLQEFLALRAPVKPHTAPAEDPTSAVKPSPGKPSSRQATC